MKQQQQTYGGNATRIAGVDEVGRGPLAGPVVAAAVIFPAGLRLVGLDDSKKLSPRRRERLAQQIKEQATAWAIGRAEVEEIDDINILQASLLAMQRAVEALHLAPDYVLVDGNRCPRLPCPAEAIVKGDSKVPEISAASIIAKVARDQEMVEMDIKYPGYGLAQHKGYPSKMHIAALEQLGASPIHRISYAPVRRVIEQGARERLRTKW